MPSGQPNVGSRKSSTDPWRFHGHLLTCHSGQLMGSLGPALQMVGWVMFAKSFRLFVSSTFLDFSDERRLLQERVFPGLEAYCAKAGFGFRAVDMRWGVNDDAQLNQRTAEICLGEVIEAKGYPVPNLLILIGDRYGWVPLPFAIARDEFEAVRDWLVAHNKGEAAADLARVYSLDENHLAPGGLATAGADFIGAYTLRSSSLSGSPANHARFAPWRPLFRLTATRRFCCRRT